MKRILILSVLSFFALSFFAATSSAGTSGDRQAKQRARIHQGVKSGSLVPGEARRLAAEQRHIKRTRQRMRGDDGKLGPGERARLDRMQGRASRHIFRAKHNGRAR